MYKLLFLILLINLGPQWEKGGIFMCCRQIIMYFLVPFQQSIMNDVGHEHDVTKTATFQIHSPLTVSVHRKHVFVQANTSSHACCDQSLSSLH